MTHTITRTIMGVVTVAAATLLTTNAAAQDYDPMADDLFMSHSFEKATERYLKVFGSNPSNKANPGLLRRITESVMKSEMVRDTARYFADLYLEFEPEDAEAYFMAAQAHFHAHDFDVALVRLDSFLVRTTTEEQLNRADKLNSWIRNARRFMRDTLPNPLINLGEQINTKNNELNPFLINGGKTLVFSCDDKFDREANMSVYNIKASDQTDLSWSPARKISGPVNTLHDEHPTGGTPNGFFFCTNASGDFALHEAQYAGMARCTGEEKMPKPINRKGSEVAGCLTEDGDTLYFSATSANGNLDIYYSIRSFNGQWMTPRPVAGLVNREESDENYPVLANHGTRLYFSSNREGTMGGYDLYYSDFDIHTNEWGAPVHMPYPINDTYDNTTISFSEDGRYAFLSLFRDDSYGGRDIYALLFNHILPKSAIIRYTVKVRNSKAKIFDVHQQPQIKITDKDGELVAIERVNMRNHSFLVVLDPGEYTLTIDLEGTKHYKEKVVVKERSYDTKPIEKKIMLQTTK